MFCPQCGEAMPAGGRFCSHCGSGVSTAGSVAPPSVGFSWRRVAIPLLAVIGLLLVVAGVLFFLKSKTPTEALLDLASAIVKRDDARFKEYLTPMNRDFFDREFGSLSHFTDVYKTSLGDGNASVEARLIPHIIPFGTLAPTDQVNRSAKTITEVLTQGSARAEFVTTFSQERQFGNQAIVDGVTILSIVADIGKRTQSHLIRYVLGQEGRVWRVECLFVARGDSFGGVFPEACPDLPEGIGVDEQKVSVSFVNLSRAWKQFGDNGNRSKMAANEAAAAASVRTIGTANVTYAATYNIGFAGTLAQLGPTSAACPVVSSACADLLESVLSRVAHPVKSGYTFTYSAPGAAPNATYSVVATPVSPGISGKSTFCLDQTNVVKKDPTGNAAAGTAFGCGDFAGSPM